MPAEDRPYAELETELAALHRKLSELHGTAGRAVEARIEAVRREEETKRLLVETEAAAHRWAGAVAAVRARYPADVFPANSTTVDARSGTFARRVCDEIELFVLDGQSEELHLSEQRGDHYARRAETAEATVARVQAELATWRTGVATVDSMFDGDEQAELAWTMAWRACRDLLDRHVERAVDGTTEITEPATCICQLPGARLDLHARVKDWPAGVPAGVAVAWGARHCPGSPVFAGDQAGEPREAAR